MPLRPLFRQTFLQESATSTIPTHESALPPAPVSGEQVIEGKAVLESLSGRWRTANTLEYRSRAVLDHVKEIRVEVAIHARLRRPALGRLLFLASRPGYSRLRVCDGRLIKDRVSGTSLRRAYTRSSGYRGSLTADLLHPIDFASYSVDQFFARLPFYPPSEWGEQGTSVMISAVHFPFKDPKTGQSRNRIRLTFTRGWARDDIYLDALSYEPLELVRVGFHGGVVQKVLHETFESVVLAPSLSDSLFRWTPDDEAGKGLPSG